MRHVLPALVLLPLFLDPTGSPAAEPGLHSFTLDNGLTVVVIEDHRAPVVTQMVWYRVGSADDPPGQSGTAHFLEHLMFKATDKLAEGEFDRTVEENGGSFNAFTSIDHTAFVERIAADRLDLVMGMEADRMVNLAPTEASVLSERDVVIEERRQVVDGDPGGAFNEQLMAALYPNSPDGRPTIGSEDEIAALTRDKRDGLLPRALRSEQRDPGRRRRRRSGRGPAVGRAALRTDTGVGADRPPRAAAGAAASGRAPDRGSRRARRRAPGHPALSRAATPRRRSEGRGGPRRARGPPRRRRGSPRSWRATSWAQTGSPSPPRPPIPTPGSTQQSFGLYVVPKPGVDPAEAEAALDALIARFIEQGPDPAGDRADQGPRARRQHLHARRRVGSRQPHRRGTDVRADARGCRGLARSSWSR